VSNIKKGKKKARESKGRRGDFGRENVGSKRKERKSLNSRKLRGRPRKKRSGDKEGKAA